MSLIESLQDLHSRNRIPETDYVAGHILCERCSRILDESSILKTLPRYHSTREVLNTREVFFHSQNLRQLFESSAAGCHLYAIMSQNVDLGRVEGQPDGGIVAECLGIPPNTMTKRHPRITLRRLDQNGQAVIHAESDYSLIDELLAAWDHDTLVRYSHFLARAYIGEVDDQDIVFPRPTTSSRPLLPTSTGSPETIDVVRSWLHQCLHNHPQCYPLSSLRAGSEPGSMRLPTRLIDIGEKSGQLRARLLLPSSSAALAGIQYVALSHVWSVTASDSHLMLSTNNIEDLQVDIPLEKLSQTFRDAMAVTRRLGYRYIWIDSLCIIQDSTEDWEKESITMCYVYGRSILTIAALGVNGLDGCLARRNPLLVTLCYLGELQKGIYAYPTVDSDGRHLMEHLTQEGARLPSRGWCFQERLLSPRTIYLGARELYWECSSQTRCESIPESKQMIISRRSWLSDKVAFHTLCRLSLNNVDLTLATTKPWDEGPVNKEKARIVRFWGDIVRAYSAGHLTYTKNRLIALSGIIEAIQEGTTWTPVAGTWKELWPLDLLWFFHESDEPQRRPSGLKTPSWSWLTKEGPKAILDFSNLSWSNYCLAHVIDSTTQSVAVRKHYIWEAEKETTITLKGYVRRAVWVDGRIKEKGPFHWTGGSAHHSESNSPLYFDDPPADGDSLLFLLIMSYTDTRFMINTFDFHYYGLILTFAHRGENDGKPGDHYRRVGMFKEKTYPNDGRTRFVEGAQEEVVTIC